MMVKSTNHFLQCSYLSKNLSILIAGFTSYISMLKQEHTHACIFYFQYITAGGMIELMLIKILLYQY